MPACAGRFFALLFTLLFGSAVPTRSNEPSSPNFVVIVADDMSWDDAGFSGHPSIRTPNLDRLASEGMVFDQAFLTISSCSPSRASILSARYPHRTQAEELHWPIPEEIPLFVDHLRERGYWTGSAGKWHLGDAMLERFDRVFQTDTSGFQLPSGATEADATFRETLEGDARSGCADWVPLLQSRPDARPFFVWLAALDPHRPYDQEAARHTHAPDAVRLPPYHPDTPIVRQDYLAYYEEIHRLDRFVGSTLAELERQQVAENTLILFLSDNGRPFPRDKTTLYDSGIRTPFIARWPNHTPAGARTSGMISAIDIGPTLLELAGARPMTGIDGQSFAFLLSTPSAKGRSHVFAEKNWHDFEDHSRMVRDSRFKLIHNYYADLPNTPPADAVRSPTYQEMLRLERTEGTASLAQRVHLTTRRAFEELYDLDADPHETRNLVLNPAYADIRRELRAHLARWQSSTDDYVPSRRTADEFNRVTGAPTASRVRPRLSREAMLRAGLIAP